jgi:hypothetical protein
MSISKRATKMATKSTKELLDFWMAKSLSSEAAAFELRKRGVPVPVRPVPKPYDWKEALRLHRGL